MFLVGQGWKRRLQESQRVAVKDAFARKRAHCLKTTRGTTSLRGGEAADPGQCFCVKPADSNFRVQFSGLDALASMLSVE